MGDLSGNVRVEITRKNGDTEEIQIDADDFSLVDAGSVGDPDSMNDYCCISIYRTTSQGIQLQLTARTTNTKVLDDPHVEIIDIEGHNIEKAEVTDCRIDLISLLPPAGENGF